MLGDIDYDLLEIDPDDKKYEDEIKVCDRKIAACQRLLTKWYIKKEQCRRGIYN